MIFTHQHSRLFLFLSTLSLRRATAQALTYRFIIYISIHALLAESDGCWLQLHRHQRISIHALLAESDSAHQCARPSSAPFLSTLSLRRATVLVWCSCGGACDFYPRSPCGERQNQPDKQPKQAVFLSTLSLRRATFLRKQYALAFQISIHALLAESDAVAHL